MAYTTYTSSLRRRIMVVSFLAIALVGVSAAIVSYPILSAALVREGLSEAAARHVVRHVWRIQAGLALATMPIAGLAAVWLARTITRPLQRLLAAAAQIGLGRFDTRVAVAGDDELARLAAAFNDMTGKLGQARDHFASVVQERTAELARRNDELQTQVAVRRRVEEALRENEQRLQDVLNSILAGVFLIDPHTHVILDVNEAAARQVGRPRAEILGRVCHQFVCPAEYGTCPITDLAQTLDQSERVLLTSDGASIPIIKSVTTGTFQGRPCLIESFVPIARQKKAEEDLKESLSLLKATLESTADGILVVDGLGKIKDYNEPFQRLWRLSDEVLATRDDDAALAAATPLLTDPEAFVTRVRGLYSRPKEEGNGTLHFKDGRVVEYYSKPQFVGDRITGRVWSFRDVTKAYRAKQEQDRLLHQIAAINEELSHFAYVVSHDLKAPLRGIKMLAEWLATDCRDRLGDDARENLDLLQNRVDRMHNLIDGILQYSRIGRITEDVVPVDLNTLLPEIIDAIAPPPHITIRIDGRMPVIEGEKTRITQVFQNLLSNAVKYMDKPVGEVVVACSEDADAWTFSVSDNGPGIEEKYFDRIFKIFQTLAPRDEFESTGVGLALVKKIVEQYGGRVWVISEVGKGSTFFFTFPKRRTPASEPAASKTESCR